MEQHLINWPDHLFPPKLALVEHVASAARKFSDWRDVTTDHLPMSVRAKNVLRNGEEVETLGDISSLTPEQISLHPNAGNMTVFEIGSLVSTFRRFWEKDPLSLEIDAQVSKILADNKGENIQFFKGILQKRISLLNDKIAAIRKAIEAIDGV